MAKLVDVTSEIRAILKIGGIALGIVFVLFMFFKGGEIFKNMFFPAPTPPPEEKFGKLPSVSFPSQTPVHYTYTINTLTGLLPTTGSGQGQIPDRMKVYKVITITPSLGALSSLRNTLKGIGFSENEQKINETIYQWSTQDGNTIVYDLNTNNFKISSNFLSVGSSSASLTGDVAVKAGAYQAATSFLGSINESTDDLDPDKSKATYLKIDDTGNLVEAASQNDAQYIRIDLVQKDLSQRGVYYDNLPTPPMYFIFGADSGGFAKIVDASYSHYQVDPTQSSDYGIKTPDAAFEELKKGNAFIINNKPQVTDVDITDVEVGYYISQTNPQFFTPIFVFTGDGFTAYVNALPQ